MPSTIVINYSVVRIDRPFEPSAVTLQAFLTCDSDIIDISTHCHISVKIRIFAIICEQKKNCTDLSYMLHTTIEKKYTTTASLV